MMTTAAGLKLLHVWQHVKSQQTGVCGC